MGQEQSLYQAPAADLQERIVVDAIPSEALEYAKKTRVWLAFISVLLYISVGFFFIGIVVALFLSFGTAIVSLLFFIPLVFFFLYLPAKRMMDTRAAFLTFSELPDLISLDVAMEKMRSMFTLFGYLIVFSFGIILLAVLAGIIIPLL